ncbi:tetratricopeptide repeat protein [Lentzea tibetensis]|uniref:Tetratricopeptide repeat protein n=1 Tax=Lentzea tibetensis TaxID=2591470 RepID=A0A563F265_9PSEU|nr:AfsR/SARP family transcriptional regulator [Lentzea tibetensis]TWP53828.1 tetratricopeptide repeat protein [Lentzea tibetensis]
MRHVPEERLELNVLGPFEVMVGARAVRLGGPRQRSVLALLLLNAGQVVPVDRLVDALWAGDPPRAAESTLRGYVSHLRKSLTDCGVATPGPLITRPSGYQLEVEPDQVDADRFERALADGRRSLQGGDPGEAASVLRAALGLWRGPALADLAGESWARAHCARLEQLRQAAIEARVEADLGLGRHGELLSELEVLVAEHPLRERLSAHRMLALYRSGRQAEALEVYRTTYALLAGDRGIEPDGALRELESAILRQDPALDWVAPPRPSSPAELPADVATFTGRAASLAALDDLLPGGARSARAVVISAIAGAAGIGKTALAVHWGHRVRDRFPDGQLHINLRGYDTGPPVPPVEALARFLRSLGVPADQVPIEVEEAAGRFRSLLADQRVLVLLDNAASADQVRPLLPASPGCLVLVTSRHRLTGLTAREGAVSLDLDVLSASEARELLASIIGHDRVEAEPQAAAELARLCAFLPLALRIAAANLVHGTRPRIADYVTELREGDRLTSLAVDGDEQSAVRGAFDLSRARLPPELQRLFRLLGAAPVVDFTPASAATLTDIVAERATSLLNGLAAAHLVDHHSPGRYGLHDLLRLYAAEHALHEETETEREAAIERFYDWYVQTGAAAARLLYPEMLRLPLPAAASTTRPLGFESHHEALAWLDAERVNVLAIVKHTALHGPKRVAWLLADILRGYLWTGMHTVDWLTIAQAGLAAATAEGDLHAQAASRLSLGNFHSGLSRYGQASEQYGVVLALTRRIGWLEGQATVLSQLGNVGWWSGRLTDAAENFAEALALDQRTGRRANQAANLDSLGIVYRQLGRLAEAADHSRRGLALFRECGTRMGEAVNLCNLSKICHDLGRFDDALDHLSRALALHREVGDRSNEAGTLDVLAAVHRDRGDYPRADELATAAVAMTRETGERRLEADALNTVASIHLRLGRHRRAVEQYRLALSVAQETETRYPEAEALIGLADAGLCLDQLDRARDHARRALVISGEVGYRVLEGKAHTVLAAIELAQHDTDRAVRHARRALSVHRGTGHRLGQAQALLVLGNALRHTAAGRGYRQEAVALLLDIGVPVADSVSR